MDKFLCVMDSVDRSKDGWQVQPQLHSEQMKNKKRYYRRAIKREDVAMKNHQMNKEETKNEQDHEEK